MKAGRWFTIACGLVFLFSITFAEQKVLSATENDAHPVRPVGFNSLELLPMANPLKPTELERAYLDSFVVLKDQNPCSDFYGGPLAITALNRLTQQIRPTHLDRRIAIRMTGETMIVTSAVTHFTYRLFDKVEVNLDGPFYRGNVSSARGKVPPIGPFEPNTREARVTSVLHELGHLIRRPDGQWVLPNDGGDWGQSQENTRRVLDICGERIRAVSNFSFEAELLNARSNSLLQSVAVDGTSE